MKKLCLIFLILFSWILGAQNLQKIDSLKKVFHNPKMHDTLRVNAINAVLQEYIYQNQDSANYYLENIFSYAKTNNSDYGYYQAHYNKGSLYKFQSKQDSAIRELKTANKYAQKINNKVFEAECNIAISGIFIDLSKKDSVFYYGNKALNIAKDINNLKLKGAVYVNFGIHNYYKGDYYESLKYLQKADSIFIISNDKGFNLTNVLYTIAGIHYTLNNFEQASVYYNRVNKLFKELNFTTGENAVLIRLGTIDLKQKKYDAAIDKFTKALTFFKKNKNQRFIAETSTNLAAVYLKKNQFKKAIRFNLTADSLFTILADSIGLQGTKWSLSKAYLAKNNFKLSTSYAKEALTITKKINHLEGQKNAYYQLAQIAKKQQNFKRANTYLESYNTLKDSLLVLTNTKNLQKLEIRYQTKQKEKEIALLKTEKQLAVQQKQNQRNLLLSAVVISLLGGLFFFFQYRNRQKTNKKLKELDQAKSTFFSNISHEFRTPLTLILGPIDDQLNNPDISPIQRRNLQNAKKNAKRIESLVNQLLALSKLESGKLKLQVQPKNLPQFIINQAESFASIIEDKEIKYNITVKKDEEVDWFDCNALEKIVNNLISNAVKFTPEKGKITIKVKRGDNKFTFWVKNTGSYLTPNEIDQIFNRFYQTSSYNTGTGIGLALTKELVQLHKGNIEVKSDIDEETVFKVSIPTAKTNYNKDEILTQELHQDSTTQQFIIEDQEENNILIPDEVPTLLIVDDNAEIRNYISSIFENTYKIITAKDGKEGFEKAKESIPDIIISDVMMPNINGIEFTTHVKNNELTNHIPVILLTAKTGEEDELEGIKTGADAYITKPFNSKFLKATVINLLENRRILQQRFSKEVLLVTNETTISSNDELFAKRLKKVLDNYITQQDFSVDKFSSEMGVSRMQLHRKLKAMTGQTTSEFVNSYRLNLAAKYLEEKMIPVGEVAFLVGFSETSYFTRCFKKMFGCSPKNYTKKDV